MSKSSTNGIPLVQRRTIAGRLTNKARASHIKKLLEDMQPVTSFALISDTSTDPATHFWFYRQGKADTWKSCMPPTMSDVKRLFS